MSRGLSVEVVYVDGRREKHEFIREQVTVGSSHEADLRIQTDDLSPKHILMVAREGGCWVSVARGVHTPVLFGGVPVENQEIPWNSEIDVGAITLRIGEPLETVKAREKSQQFLLRVAALLAAALIVFYFLRSDYQPPPKAPATAPELFDESEARCEAPNSKTLARGEELSAAAEAYWHRYPFDPQEGIRATRLYEEAAVCFTAGGDPLRAKNAADEHRNLVEQIDRDYQTLRLQLMRSLKHRENPNALRLVRRLARFVQHRPGEYLIWLGKVDRYVQNQE